MASMCVRAPAPLGAAQVTGYKDCLADGGAVAIEFQSPIPTRLPQRLNMLEVQPT